MSVRFNKATDWFTVHSVRSIDDPNANDATEITRKEIVVNLYDLPRFEKDDLGPNPRRPNRLNSRERTAIIESLSDNGSNFHHLNRGLTIVAKSLAVEDRKGKTRVRLELADSKAEREFYGVLDGGHTNQIINMYRDEHRDSEEAEVYFRERCVNVQVLIPKGSSDNGLGADLRDLLNDIKRARNTSVPVKRRDLENARHHFDLIKEVLQSKPYSSAIKWRDGDDGQIDGQTIIILLMIFHRRFASYGDDPTNAYGKKDICLDKFVEFSVTDSDYLDASIRFLPSLLDLYDRLELSFPETYNAAGGRFGGFSNVRRADSDRYYTQLRSETPWKYPNAWIYPLFAAFRVLINEDESSGEISWKRDALTFWENHGQEIVNAYLPIFKTIASESPTKVGRSVPAHQAVRQSVSGLLKDGLLREAGIEV